MLLNDGCFRKCRCIRSRLKVFLFAMSVSVLLSVTGLLMLASVHPSRTFAKSVDTDDAVFSARSSFEGNGDVTIDNIHATDRHITDTDNTKDDLVLDDFKNEYHISRDIDFQVRNKTKRLPHALIIGVKKAGTRALLEYLRLHPDVRAPGPETHFFDKHYDKGLKWYRSLMPETYKDQLTIEKTPSYFVTKGIPERVYRMSKKTKLIVVFRDPVTRAISDYAQLASRNPSVKSFDEMVFINNETRVIDTSWTLVKIGLYALHLSRWLEYFPLNQMLFVSGEDLIRAPASEMRRVQQFLELKQHITSDNFTYNYTKGFPCYKKDSSKSSWHCLNEEKGRQHPHIEPSVRQRLQDFYRPFNHRLFSMAGRDFNWS
ncbi:HS3SB-like protein [Mya arenaria]|uniref:HS3SB-like protein n=1 Tax=Mya arenaria TaxID=6604 RepID=A0ABY7DGT5_MYAAR|nr:heparan sulfate glucosamine 3-O-sulfotransferase 6-like [Mya arenaria]WAQ95826.1 HS3SB-like protein [Mya arenaria]